MTPDTSIIGRSMLRQTRDTAADDDATFSPHSDCDDVVMDHEHVRASLYAFLWVFFRRRHRRSFRNPPFFFVWEDFINKRARARLNPWQHGLD